MSWGDASGVPTSGKNPVVVGTDNNNSLHIRTFDATGNRTKDEDESRLPAQAAAIATLKQRLPGLSPPHLLIDAEKALVIEEATSIVGQTLQPSHRGSVDHWLQPAFLRQGARHDIDPGNTPEVEDPVQPKLSRTVLRALHLVGGHVEREVPTQPRGLYHQELLAVVSLIEREDIEPEPVAARFRHQLHPGREVAPASLEAPATFDLDGELLPELDQMAVDNISRHNRLTSHLAAHKPSRSIA
jgi:hypothetical protein